MPELKPVAAESPADAPAPQPKPQLAPLPRGAVKFSEQCRNAWLAVIPRGIDFSAIDGNSAYWGLQSDVMREGDTVTLIAADRSQFATAMCVHSTPGCVVVRLLHTLDGPGVTIANAPKSLPDGISIERTPPGDPLGSGFFGVRARDGAKFLNSGKPWPTWQDCYEGILQHAAFRADRPVMYL